MDYIIIGLLIINLVLIVVSLFKNINESTITITIMHKERNNLVLIELNSPILFFIKK